MAKHLKKKETIRKTSKARRKKGSRGGGERNAIRSLRRRLVNLPSKSLPNENFLCINLSFNLIKLRNEERERERERETGERYY